MNTPVTAINLEPGVYTNVFLVIIPEGTARLVVALRSNYQDLRPLRKHIQDKGWNAQVYAPSNSDKVYGFGQDMDLLAGEGFQEENVNLSDTPQLTTRLITEGMVNLLRASGYEARFGKGRTSVFPTNEFKPAANGKIRVYQGYDLRSTFWWDQSLGRLAFGLVVDVTWSIRDQEGRPLNMAQVAELKAATQIAQIQGEYLPGGARINTEVARQRLQEQILPFVREHSKFELPCRVTAELSPQPVRVIIGGHEG